MDEVLTYRYREPNNQSGYWFNETTDDWKVFWGQYPCSPAVQIPNTYPTKFFDDPILSEATESHVVIQLWKGLCPKFLGAASYPGGVGAEVGIYYRSTLDPFSSTEWWPFLTGSFEIQYHLVYQDSEDPIFSTQKEKTWWLNKWMEEESYARFRQNNPRAYPENEAFKYRLVYEINGHTYPTW